MDDSIPQKRCYKCDQTYPLNSFYSNKTNPDSKADECKKCAKAIQIERRKNHDNSVSKRCSHCKEIKPASDFNKAYVYCKVCARALRREYYEQNEKGIPRSEEGKQSLRRLYLQHNYKLTPEEYDEMFRGQTGLCAICGQPEQYVNKGSTEPSKLAIDHCHETGLIRELLCRNCNAMIGYAHDNPEILKKAIAYLKKHSMRKQSFRSLKPL